MDLDRIHIETDMDVTIYLIFNTNTNIIGYEYKTYSLILDSHSDTYLIWNIASQRISICFIELILFLQ
jgi:hypothetical protein